MMDCSRCKKPMNTRYGAPSSTSMDFCFGCAQEIGIYSLDELVLLSRMLDSYDESTNFSSYNRDRIRKLILTALRGALRDGRTPDVSFPVVSFEVPNRDDVAAEPVRAFVEGDVLVQEFRIVGGPREGQILTMRTKMVP
jgi:hypothetical protein